MPNPKTILFVDDEEFILRSVKRSLDERDYKILTASSGAEGLEVVNAEEVPVIFSDYRMPNMSGTEFLSQVKEQNPNTVSAIFSGYSDMEDIYDAMERGDVQFYLHKPWKTEKLIELIEMCFTKVDENP